MRRESRTRKQLIAERIGAVLFALILWQVVAMLLNETLLMATPVGVVKRLSTLVFEPAFWGAVWFSFKRIVLGFFLALCIGTVLAVFAARVHIVETLLWPFISIIKATPVASFIILCLVWLNAKNLSVFISLLMVVPIIYTNVLQGILSTDVKLLEMAHVFKMSWGKQFVYIYLPQLKSYLLSACSVSLGIAWKSGVAAEVIGVPGGSIGERLYQAKLYLDSPELFAWTAVIIVVSVIFEKLILVLLKQIYKKLEAL